MQPAGNLRSDAGRGTGDYRNPWFAAHGVLSNRRLSTIRGKFAHRRVVRHPGSGSPFTVRAWSSFGSWRCTVGSSTSSSRGAAPQGMDAQGLHRQSPLSVGDRGGTRLIDHSMPPNRTIPLRFADRNGRMCNGPEEGHSDTPRVRSGWPGGAVREQADRGRTHMSAGTAIVITGGLVGGRADSATFDAPTPWWSRRTKMLTLQLISYPTPAYRRCPYSRTVSGKIPVTIKIG